MNTLEAAVLVPGLRAGEDGDLEVPGIRDMELSWRPKSEVLALTCSGQSASFAPVLNISTLSPSCFKLLVKHCSVYPPGSQHHLL